METLGAFMRRRRDELDISLRELAKKLNCSAAFISDIELGKRHPSDKVLTDISHHLQVPIQKLHELDSRPPIDEIKKLTLDDPRYALAFRTMIEKKVSPEELMKLANRKRTIS